MDFNSKSALKRLNKKTLSSEWREFRRSFENFWCCRSQKSSHGSHSLRNHRKEEKRVYKFGDLQAPDPFTTDFSVTPENALAMDVFHSVLQSSSNPDENTAFSPHGMKTALAAILPGTDGNLHAALTQFLCPDGTNYDAVASSLKVVNLEAALNCVNAVFYDNDSRFPVLPYLATAVDISFVRTPFRMSPDAAAFVMDRFVTEKTDGSLRNYHTEVPRDTGMILLNIEQISPRWEMPFNPLLTKSRIFHCPNNVEKSVDFMHHELLTTRNFNVFECEDDNPQVVILDLAGRKFSVMIILPYWNSGGTEKLQEKMTIGNLLAWRQKCVWRLPYQLQLFLPKFRIRCGVDLKSCATDIGLQQLFEESESAYRRMFESNAACKIDEFKQGISLEINELGEKPPLPLYNFSPALNWGGSFVADRPFFFVLWNETANVPVVMGRITDPSV
ncbi:serpin B5-like [Paramacrobiotus metropolitanus]|uniref:serpin B5-like n=1 Tax=Paramacrobiotus metropolitanus TaxID=2943436 RepID=UPI00244646F7|nr:serpin B5-like [Paramacrobiotus metropolitanus]